MRVSIVSTHDVHGGAARAAYRLHMGLRAAGAESTYYVKERRLSDRTIQAFVPDPSPAAIARRDADQAAWISAYNRYADTRSPDIELFSPARWDMGEHVQTQRPRADIINVHWIARFLDYRYLFDQTRTRCPVVWTLHDMNPFTGGCHYDQGCGKYIDACGACPLLGSLDESDLSRSIFEEKIAALADWPDRQLHIVAPSRWLVSEAAKSSLFGRFSGTHIPNGIEIDRFAPQDKAKARQRLGLPQDAKIVAFVANHIKLARKGFRELMQALSLIPDAGNVMLLGVGDSHVLGFETPFKVGLIDFVRDDAQLAAVYAAADLTAIPSQQDNLPNAILESLACATPVVGFSIGGIPDVIKHGENGFLASPGNVGALSLAIMDAFRDMQELAACGQRGRRLIERDFTLDVQAQRYLRLFESLIG